MSQGKFWSSEKILSVCAILISLGTFASIVYQNGLIRQQQSATVLPYLEIWNSQSESRYSLMLMNNGIGPAFIREIRILYKGETFEKDPYTFFYDDITPPDSIERPVYYSNVIPGRLIPAGEQVEMIGVQDNKASADFLRSIFSDDSVARVEIEFESVYGERWLASGMAKEPVRMD